MGERAQQTYHGWRRACKKKADPQPVQFQGDKDICEAMVAEPTPHSIGEWDGAQGCVYND